MIFGSKILRANGMFANIPCQGLGQWELIPISLPSSGDNSNYTSVCPEVVNPSLPLLTTIPSMFESSSLIALISSSSSFHTTVKDQTFIMATPTSYFPSNYPTISTLPSTSILLKENSTLISYSSPSSITTKQSQFTTELMKMYSSLVTVTSSSSVTYTLPYSSPIPTLATPTLVYASHTNGSVSQTSARSSLTSPWATPSPTMLFCSESSEDGKWPKTPACTNATSTNCGNNSSHANG